MNFAPTWGDVAFVEEELSEMISKVVDSPKDIMLWDDHVLSDRLGCDLASVQRLKLELGQAFLSRTDQIQYLYLSPKKRIKFGVPLIDFALGGGLLANTVNELYGQAGSGKTQLCMQLLATTVISDKNAHVFFINTQERFIIERLIDFLPQDIDQRECLDRVHLQYFLDPEEELRFILYELPIHMQNYNYKLIIYDGIASNARVIESAFDKSAHLNQLVSSFRRMLASHEAAVLITNQITDIPGEVDLIQKPALGLSLDNNVNIKICLEYNKSSGKRSFNLVKSVFTPLSQVYFTIESHGIKGVEPEFG